MTIGAQLKPLPAVVGATCIVGNAGDVAEREFAGVGIGAELGLDLLGGVVEDKFVVLVAVNLFAAETGQCVLAR